MSKIDVLDVEVTLHQLLRLAGWCPLSARVWLRWTPWPLTPQSLMWHWASGQRRRRDQSRLTSGPQSQMGWCFSATANPDSSNGRTHAHLQQSRWAEEPTQCCQLELSKLPATLWGCNESWMFCHFSFILCGPAVSCPLWKDIISPCQIRR